MYDGEWDYFPRQPRADWSAWRRPAVLRCDWLVVGGGWLVVTGGWEAAARLVSGPDGWRIPGREVSTSRDGDGSVLRRGGAG